MSFKEKLESIFPTFQKRWFLAILLFLITLTVYLITLAPTVSTEDSGEFIAAAYTLGIPHPPGYPLWTILGKLFTFLPISNIAWRVNFMSAFFASATVAFLFILLLEIVKNKFIAFISSLIFAFTDIFWSQSVRAEVYTLNTFFMVLTLYLIIRWAKTKNRNFLYFFAFIFGLSITNHQGMILLAPAFIIFVLISEKEFWKNYKAIIMMLLLFLIGISVYLYLPIRSAANPPIDWGNPENFTNFIGHVTRAQYGEGIMASITNEGKILLLGNFFVQLIEQFKISIVIGVIGLLILFFREKKTFFLLLLIFSLTFLGVVYLRKLDWYYSVPFVLRVLYLPPFLISIVFIATGASYLWDKLNSLIKIPKIRNTGNIIFMVCMIVFSLSLLMVNFQKNNQSENYLAYDRYSQMLESLPLNSTLVSLAFGPNSDTAEFVLAYLKVVEKKRKDVVVFTFSPIYSGKATIQKSIDDYKQIKSSLEDLLERLYKEKPEKLFITSSVDQLTELGFVSKYNGGAFKVFANWEEWREDNDGSQLYYLRNFMNGKYLPNDPFTDELISEYYYNLAHLWLDRGQEQKSHQEALRAISYDFHDQGFYYTGFVIHRTNYLNEFKSE